MTSDVLHVATIKTDSDSENTVALSSNAEDLFVESLLLFSSERGFLATRCHNLGAFINDALRGTLEEDLVVFASSVALNDSAHALALRAKVEGGDG